MIWTPPGRGAHPVRCGAAEGAHREVRCGGVGRCAHRRRRMVRALHGGAAHRVCLHRLLPPGGFQLAQDVCDVAGLFGEDVLGEAGDVLGDTRGRHGADAVDGQDFQQQSPERRRQEGVRARLPVAVVHGVTGMMRRAATSRSIRCRLAPSLSSATAQVVSTSSACKARM
ncbi:hypothetical protein ACFQ61_03755 [Streptomyces sp. NPDC056500]|uniref:hypothetical protein n=1 Tax=Streptomyces sp. NPDC056500 TaxID=3345840 RepID=UPI0036A21652